MRCVSEYVRKGFLLIMTVYLTSFGIFVDCYVLTQGLYGGFTARDDKLRLSMLFVRWSNRITPENASV